MIWAANNIGTLIIIATMIFGGVAAWVLYGADIRQLKKDLAEVKGTLHEVEKIMREHMSDTSLHIDPHRDEKRWDDLKSEIFRRFDGMEGKIEKLMLVHSPPPI